ncbi:hypothetical protein [Levilactobacillus enshiensis]|uniref:hypothetical protein n=1 Tax=Levilactobacillus enshiensis TaxID=2590213 RepID=UPI00117B72EE|nr:hypothetical protein [Levilactobacillus enshiensis]
MQKLYPFVPLLNIVGEIYFLLILTFVPDALTSLGAELHWQAGSLQLVAVLGVIVCLTFFARSRRLKRVGLVVNAGIIAFMSVYLWHSTIAPSISEYVWLWSLLMIFNLGLIGWGWMQLARHD